MMPDPFVEQWFCEASQEALADLGRSVTDVDGLVLEIGAWTGRSTCALARAIAPRVVHSVDTWQGSPSEISAGLAANRDVFAQWQRNVAMFTRGNVVGHRMGWREFVPTITDPVALAFIDAEHTYTEVADNIRALLPLVAAGGVLCGDDAHHPPVRQAVADTLGTFEQTATLWVWRPT